MAANSIIQNMTIMTNDSVIIGMRRNEKKLRITSYYILYYNIIYNMDYIRAISDKLGFGKCQCHLSRLSRIGSSDVWPCRNLCVPLHLEKIIHDNNEQ